MKTRKILTLALALLTFIGFTSCNKTEKKIIGTWECTSSAIIDGEEGEEIEMEGSTFTFNSDKTVSITSEGETQTGTYTVEDEHLVLTFNMSEEGMSVTINMDVDVLEITKTNMTIEGKMDILFAGQLFDSTKFKASFKKI